MLMVRLPAVQGKEMTTPHSSKLEASGMTPVCRPTPLVRLNQHARAVAHHTTHVLVGTANGWGARAFTRGSLPRNLQTRFGWKSADELLVDSFGPDKGGNDFPPTGGAPFIPMRERRGRRGAGKEVIHAARYA